MESWKSRVPKFRIQFLLFLPIPIGIVITMYRTGQDSVFTQSVLSILSLSFCSVAGIGLGIALSTTYDLTKILSLRGLLISAFLFLIAFLWALFGWLLFDKEITWTSRGDFGWIFPLLKTFSILSGAILIRLPKRTDNTRDQESAEISED